ncbi:MAG TPA: hypothetical protein VFQ05_08295, partial [Candidatus Eisenbacteria bacterium]|nr:hypothetical protein [Candidatus Eisenbacteria bacterium]
AQELPDPGARVRVHSTPRERKPVLGVLEAWKPDTLVVLSDSAATRLSIPMAHIVRFETSAGKGPATREGAQTGAILGALAGLTIAALNDNNEMVWKYPLGGTLGMIAGAGVGAVVGSARRIEQWKAAPIPQPRPANAPSELPAAVRVRIQAPRDFGDEPRTGILVRRAQDSLTFLPDGKGSQSITLAIPHINRLEVGDGRRHHAWTGATTLGLLGVVVGAGLGGALASMEGGDYAAGGALVGGLTVGGLGFVAGMFLGGLSEYEHWEPVPLDAK